MNVNQVIKRIDHASHYCLLGMFLFSSVAFLFMFVINWEAWFFSFKLDGLFAGIDLLSRFLIAAILAYVLIKYPYKILGITAISVGFYGFLCLDSAITIYTLTKGQESFSIVPILLVLVPTGILLVQILAGKPGEKDNDAETGNTVTHPAFATVEQKKPDQYATGNTLLIVLAATLAVLLIGPAVPSLFFSVLHSPASSLVPVGDSLLSKVDANGTTEWQTLIQGYSEFPVNLAPAPDGGLILGGMFRLPGYTDSGLRVMELDHNGNPAWDFQRSVSAYPETNLGALSDVLPTAGEYTVIMVDGFVIRLDARGNELWHRDYPDTFVQTSLSRPDGGYFLIGEAHEGSPSEPGWKKFDGWILNADRQGNIIWEKKEQGFSNCGRALQSPDGILLASCSVAGTDPSSAGNKIVALDPQGNIIWNKNFVEKTDGIVNKMNTSGNGTFEVFLHGEGERKYTLDQKGNVLKDELLPAGPYAFSHESVPDISYTTESLTGNRTRVSVRALSGRTSVFTLGYPANRENLSHVYSANPTSDGGYLVSNSAES